ncbi:MAG: hydrogenase nickel incorporation protein HypB, partial [Chloroflexota bacterium]
LEATLTRMKDEGYAVAALVGDLATDNDAMRLERSGAPVRQISTGGNCHLEADMIENHLGGWNLNEIDFLFVENVGNLVCPSSYDLGENIRVVLLSVTEGEDKPLKYPPLFNSSDVAIVTKVDLAEVVEFDEAAALDSIEQVCPGMQVFKTSAKTGAGLEAWVDYLVRQRQQIFVGDKVST